MVFCLIVQSEARQGNCCFTGRRASTCSLCNAYAPMLTLSSVSVTYNSGSLLFLPHYFGKKITALGGEKKKKKSHFIIIREARPFQSFRAFWKFSPENILWGNWKEPRLVQESFLGIWDLKEDKIAWRRKAYWSSCCCSSCSSGSISSLPVLPRGASSFFPCYFWIHLFPFPKDVTWSQSPSMKQQISCFLMPRKYSQSPSDNRRDGGSRWEHQPAPGGAGDGQTPQQQGWQSTLSLFLRLRELSLFTNLCVDNLIFVDFPRLMVVILPALFMETLFGRMIN